MISILVVEDNARKASKISAILTEVDGITEENITIAPDKINAKRLLLEKNFDLLLLDIELPNRFDQTPQKSGGLILLEEIKSSEKYQLPFHIIGLTAYDDIYEQVNSKFADQLMFLEKYDETSINWQNKIKKKVDYLISSKKSLRLLDSRYFKYDIGIICALGSTELESVRNQSTNWKEYPTTNDGTIYHTCTFKDSTKELKVIAAAAPQMGMAAAASLTMKIIYNFNPKYLAIPGIAAGVEGTVNLGDILIADPSWDYGSGKITGKDTNIIFNPDTQPIRLDTDLKARFQNLSLDSNILDEIKRNWPGEKPDTNLRLHIGPVASGSAVLAHPKILEIIQAQQRKLIGIDMETYGVLYAASNCVKPRPIAFSIKSVSDFADANKNDRFQKYAAYTSMALLRQFALTYL